MIHKKIIGLYKDTRTRMKLVDLWKEFMAISEVYNADYKTYTLYNIQKCQNGYKAELFAPEGLKLIEIDNLKDKIEDTFHCNFQRGEVKYSPKYESDYCDITFTKK